MIRTSIYETGRGYWAVDITEIGKQTDTYYFELPEDAMRFKDKIDSETDVYQYFEERREIDKERTDELSEALRELAEQQGGYDE